MSFRSVLQTKSTSPGGNGSPPGVVTLTSAPTPGNLILAFVVQNPGAGAFTLDTSKWTLLEATGSTYGKLVYRYAVGGDTAALPAFGSAGNTYWAAAVAEIQNVTGVIANDVKQHETGTQSGSSPHAIAGMTTDSANQLALVWGACYSGTGGTVFSAGWTRDENYDNFGNYGCIGMAEQLFTASGSSVACNITDNTALTAYAAVRLGGDTAVNVTGSGSIGTDTATPPSGSAEVDATGSGSIGTVTASAPTGVGSGEQARTSQVALQVLYDVALPPAATTQAALQVLYEESPPARTTELVLQVLWSGPRRVRRVGMNVQAKRIVPFTNPIVQDAWPNPHRDPV